ncbi:MAG: triose-phosphate isomerase [Candidatus Portnoybacteria bacterium CG_4_8_14_3_um_filter_40_10]|uniref:Triosephosphate isomerase n=4 Tax=Candidatus Portnoyibacteriota TaxID=1817913 RepID=A0A2M7IHP3_9BACT|nr:MAG: triose-phosphate isomerase [Candidatus Portnoybacteria bacterium CG11_big_fil_rev_8_21_14_0_20_40_15]PIS31968.1 MAG: triose-phosphate isomerase [Candidatus Portnoybacteria bacterium CG08_land_8_20_14_0_20_40_83]PIW76053.1 MAG: triose-phosphate isomerase [Candidatus Portnoybacteria bacterium CG_4_8_14_3_um_filter_40_10]PIY75026.1 MAG: triose-phosphate isomerase [Candidatus Portnoybacteria bacterium CG_4_10_14_0_8_um_filter_40_50]PJA64731.1 MAG: triose-phosphate isomerase [Candidatus Port
MDKKILVANWKMNPQTAREARVLFDAMINVGRLKNIETVICPPYPFLPIFGSPKSIKLGGQDIFWEPQGAFTGEISGKMLKNLGCEYVILGHSERRQFLGETDETVNLKLKMALKENLTPIFCIGEREGEEMSDIVENQLKQGLADIGKNQIEKIVIAYEPVWAISTGVQAKPCLPDDALSAAVFIRKILTGLFGKYLGGKIRIIYGGSVDSGNAAGYLKQTQMVGVLVGGASLDPQEFSKIANSLNNLA